MKLKLFTMALGALILTSGAAAFAQEPIDKTLTNSVGRDESAAGGTDFSGSGGMRGATTKAVVVDSAGNCCSNDPSVITLAAKLITVK